MAGPVVPLEQKSSLQSVAGKNALTCIPEGCEEPDEGAVVEVQLLDSRALNIP